MTDRSSSGSPSMAPSASFKSHWWWRPGWKLGRRMYTFFLTFDEIPEIAQRITSHYASALAVPMLDRIPPEWLHLTFQGVGFIDEVPDNEIATLVKELRQRCLSTSPLRIALERPVVAEEGVVSKVYPLDELRKLRRTVRTVLTEVRDPSKLDGGDAFTPHLTLAYSNSTGSTAQTVQDLDRLPDLPVEISFNKLQLISLGRDRQMYEWEVVANVPLAESTS
jgi:2'-5' RNA ligase